MSFIYFLICIAIFIWFSIEDLQKLNPITTISEIPDSERKIVDMNKEKIWIPFRMVNYENKFIDHRGVLHIIPYLIEGKLDDSIGMDLKYHLLNYKFCNETSMINNPDNYKIDAPLNQLFCIDRDELLFGGNWNNDFLYYIEINLYLCDSGIPYNVTDPRCSKLDEYLKTLNSSLLFDFYYPMVQFQPRNINSPIKIIYKNYYYRLSSYSYKIQKLFIKQHILTDDTSIIKTKYSNSTFWGMSNLLSDDYFLSSQYDPISHNNNNSRVYALNIYMDDGLVYYTRSFKKLFLIISNVFPLFRFALFFIKKFTQHIKMSFTKRKLAGFIFENKELPKKAFTKNLEDLNINSKNANNKLVVLTNKSENELIKNKTINNNLIINYNNNIQILKNNTNKEKSGDNSLDVIKDINKDNTKGIKANHNVFYNNYILKNKINQMNKIQNNDINETDTINIKIKKKLEKDKNYKYIFPIYYFLLDIIFDNIKKPNKFFCISKVYFTVYNFMCQIYDISTHIILFKQFNLLNNIMLEKSYTETGVCPIKPYNKINICDINLVDKLNKDLEKRKSIIFSNNL